MSESIQSVERGAGAGGAGTAEGHVQLVERYFDDNAQSWSELYQKAQRVNDIVLADRRDSAVAALVEGLPAKGRVLDAGCGAGLTGLALAEEGFEVLGVDVSKEMLALGRKNFAEKGIPEDRYSFECVDVVAAEYPEESFDGIAALGFLQYQKDELEALAALKRMLKPGGVLVVTGPTRHRLSNFFGMHKYYYKARRGISRMLGRPHGPTLDEAAVARVREISVHAYSVSRFRSLLRAAGFEILRGGGHGFANWAIIGRRLGFKGELALHRFLTRASRVLPVGRFANDIVFVARKPGP